MNQKDAYETVVFKFIEAHLILNQKTRPKTISDQFSMHQGTASKLLNRYCSLCPLNITYINRYYRIANTFTASYLDIEPEHFLQSIITVFGYPKVQESKISDSELIEVYQQTKSIQATADQLKISFPTAQKRLSKTGITAKQGYKPIDVGFTGLQCRQAREYLGLIREQFCKESSISVFTLRQFELGKSGIREETKNRIVSLFKKYHITLENNGLFIDHTKKNVLKR